MIYKLPFKKTGLYPEVIGVLNDLNESDFHNSSDTYAYPIDVFFFAFKDVIDCITRLTDRYFEEIGKLKANSQYVPQNLEQFRIDIFNLLFFSANFVESCQTVIKLVYCYDEKIFNKASREFKDLTKEYRGHASKIINEIKHKHRRVRPFSSIWDRNIIIGYYIEGVVGKGVVGPDPLVHDRFHGMATGFSLNREIPYHLVNLYYVSACLSSTIIKYSQISKERSKFIEDDAIKECLIKVSALPLMYLPDEFDKKGISIENKNSEEFRLEYPAKLKMENRKPHTATISLSNRVGIKNRSFTIPYFKK